MRQAVSPATVGWMVSRQLFRAFGSLCAYGSDDGGLGPSRGSVACIIWMP